MDKEVGSKALVDLHAKDGVELSHEMAGMMWDSLHSDDKMLVVQEHQNINERF